MFAVPEADAVVDPGTVVVHIEHAAVAGRAVVTPFGLEHIAHKTVPPPLVLRVALVEALKRLQHCKYPEDRNLAGVSQHRL